MTKNVIGLEAWKNGDKELARLDRGELSLLFVQQADEIAQLMDKAKEAALRMGVIHDAIAAHRAMTPEQAKAFALFIHPLLDHLVASHDLGWNLVMLARDISKGGD